MKSHLVRQLIAGSVVVSSVLIPGIAPAQAQTATPSRAAASFADAIGIKIDLTLVSGSIPVKEEISRASQSFPPGAQAPADDTLINPTAPPVIRKARTVGALAGASAGPQATASAETEGLEALMNGQVPVVQADVIRAQSNSDCVNDPNAEGTIILGLKLAGTTVPVPQGGFAPNSEPPTPIKEALALLGIRAIINEQKKASDGRGLVVNGLHLFDIDPSSLGTLFNGDLIISHAVSAVNCPNGRGTTGADTAVFIDKVASIPLARPGETVTYTATIRNKSTQGCLVNQFIDHLATPFEFVSTAGQLGAVATTATRPGGGTDVILKPKAFTIAPNASATQTFTVKVKADAAPGVYFNNTELLCGNLGNFIGIDAPVEIPGARPPAPRVFICSDGLDNDGDGKIDFPADPGCDSPQDDSELNSLPRTGADRGVALLLGGLLIAAAVGVRRFRTAL